MLKVSTSGLARTMLIPPVDKEVTTNISGSFSEDPLYILRLCKCPIDLVLATRLEISEKLCLIANIIGFVKINCPNWDIGISICTITKLLQIREETDNYYGLFSIIIDYGYGQKLLLFTYEHIYQLIIQLWMEIPSKMLSIEFRKKLIVKGLNSHLPATIIENIKFNVETWFSNLNKNSQITLLVEWFCELDSLGQLLAIKKSYEKTVQDKIEEDKAFKRKYNITIDEYNARQQVAKKNGLCKFIRQRTECPYNVNCTFYHGRLEETFGIQECRTGDKCQLLQKGECKFLHTSSPDRIDKTKKFYSQMNKLGESYLVPKEKVRQVDLECLYNPYIVLQKIETNNKSNYTKYVIPRCKHTTNKYGIEHVCNKRVLFMTKNNTKIKNFYCCYEHMVANEPAPFYVVKQNILDQM